jgi:transcriptional regulator with XRE-family HTH domain
VVALEAVASLRGECSMRVRELGRFIRDQRGAARLSLRKLSKLAGISNPYLSQIERGLRRPSAEILQAIARALRISAETLYVKAGILDERREEVDLPAAIRRDATLSAAQKRILLDLYASFRRGETTGDARSVRRVAAARRPGPAKARGPAAPRTTAPRSGRARRPPRTARRTS